MQIRTDSSLANVILVKGTGNVVAPPDIARLSLGVESIAGTVSEARGAAAAALDAIVGELRGHGVSNDDIKTTSFNIKSEYDYHSGREPRFIGFRVSNFLNVTVRDLEVVGELIDAAAKAGGDMTRVNNINFDIKNRADAQREAWKLAARDAIAQADLFAAETGITRGAPVSISTVSPSLDDYADRGMVAYAQSEPEPDTPILPGSLSIEATVTIAFAIGA